jgi:hypothetical protein
MQYKRNETAESPETAGTTATGVETADGRYAPSHRAAEGWTIGRAEASTRRLSRGRKLWYGLLAYVLGGIMRWFWWTCRVQPVIGSEHLDELQSSGSPAIIAYWHQMHLLCANYLLRRAKAGDRIAFLISPSLTGEVPTAAARHWNIRVLRGSSTRSGGRSMREMHQVMVRDRYSMVVTADGPRGPLHEFKPGALLMSRMTGAPIVPIAYGAKRSVNWNSWDRFIVPLPFTRVALAIGEPFRIPKDTRIEDLPEIQRQIEVMMQKTAAQANEAVKEQNK